MKKSLSTVSLIGLSSLLLSSCFQPDKDLLEPVIINHDLIPVAHGRIDGLGLFSQSLDIISIDPDNATLSIKDNIELFSIRSSEVVQITNGNLDLNLNLNPIPLADRDTTYISSFGKLIENAPESNVIYTQDDLCDQTVPISSVIAPILTTETNSFKFSADNITKVKYNSGKLVAEFISDLDINLIDIKLNHYDNDNTTLLSTFPLTQTLDSKATLMEEVALDGKLLSGNGFFRLEFASDGSGANQVCVDTNQNIIIALSFEEAKVDSGEFAFPDVTQTHPYSIALKDIGSSNRLVKASFTSGELKFKATSTLKAESSINFNYDFVPQIPNKAFKLAPSTVSITYSDSLNGAEFDFSGLSGNKTNRAEGEITISIEATNEHIQFNTKQPSFLFTNQLLDFQVNRLQGNFGEINRVGFDTKPMLNGEFYERITNGDVTIKGGLATFNIMNTFGMDGALDFDSKSINGFNGNVVSFNPSAYSVLAATENPLENNPGNLKNIDNTNSNIDEYFSNIPKRFDTDYSLVINRNNDTLDTDQFLYAESEIVGVLQTNLPLNLNFKNFSLFDTTKFDINAIPDNGFFLPKQREVSISGAFLNLETMNKFPFDISATIIMLDQDNEIIDTLIADYLVISADVDADGYVSKTRSQSSQIIVTDSLTEDLANTRDFLLEIKLNQPDGKHREIRSDYFFDFSFILDHTYSKSVL